MSNEHIPVAANVLGTIGTVFWCVQLVPQIWHNWRHKKTDGLPQSMMLLWAVCMFLSFPLRLSTGSNMSSLCSFWYIYDSSGVFDRSFVIFF